ncbi:MAG: [LysW]-aminoadipate kinase [Candidatus Woesearchaeota archaeon]|nr:[LysW]-aminoadipate kinase [Candidatus Woesearchaeota archaeon]
MIILKVGGGSTINHAGIAAGVGALDKVIIVHGANAARDKLAEDLGRPKKTVTSVSGYESVLADEQALDAMLMAYPGLIGKRFVEHLQQAGVNAIGLAGIDGKVIQGRRNRGIRVEENGKKIMKHDLSGKPQAVNKELLRLLLEHDYTPVLTVPILDEQNVAISSENDDIVVKLQEAFQAEKIIHFIEAPGFLDDKDDEASLVSRMTQAELAEREEQTAGRMKRKMLALRKLFAAGAREVVIADGRTENPVQDAHKGTVIT